MDMVGERCRHVAFFLYSFLNEYYTDLEFLMDFMNIFLYNFFKIYFCDYLLNLHVLR